MSVSTEDVSNTLYINRISEKASVDKIKLYVFTYFSQYGQILDISAHRGLKRRGQAWVTFESIESAVSAKRGLNNIILFDTPIQIKFAKKRNIATLKLYGSYNPYGRKKETIKESEAEKLAIGHIPFHMDIEMRDDNEDIPLSVIKPLAKSVQPVIVAPSEISLQETNKILFVQNIPEGVDKTTLDFIFGQYPGFVECRVLPGKGTMAFVEYENEEQSGTALSQLNGIEIDDGAYITIQYAKK